MSHRVTHIELDSMDEFQTQLAITLLPGDEIIRVMEGRIKISDPVTVFTAVKDKKNDIMRVTSVDGTLFGFHKFDRLWIRRLKNPLHPVDELQVFSAKNALRNLSK
jgi:hypothetical protein